MISSFTKAAEIEVIQYDGPTECDFDDSVRPGHYVRVHYIGSIDERSQQGEAGKEFDSTYDRDIPLYFQSGTGQGNPGKFVSQIVFSHDEHGYFLKLSFSNLISQFCFASEPTY